MIERKMVNFSGFIEEQISSLVFDGRISDKGAFEDSKMDLIAKMINLVVNGGIVVVETSPKIEGSLNPQTLISKLLDDLEKSVSIIQINSSELLVGKLSDEIKKIIYIQETKTHRIEIFRDTISDKKTFCGLEFRNSSGHDEDLKRIKSTPEIKEAINNKLRPLRRSDINLITALTSGSTRKILVAEDEDHLGRLIQFKLEREGFEVKWVKNGQEALDSIAEDIPDLLVLDIMMPILNGYQVLKHIRENKDTQNLRVIFLSAKGGEREVVRGIELGADDYIVKPFRPAELAARIKHTISE